MSLIGLDHHIGYSVLTKSGSLLAYSMDWLEGKVLQENHRSPNEVSRFPAIFPLNQSIDDWVLGNMGISWDFHRWHPHSRMVFVIENSICKWMMTGGSPFFQETYICLGICCMPTKYGDLVIQLLIFSRTLESLDVPNPTVGWKKRCKPTDFQSEVIG